ncbi:hypothetical protein JB92DRAFT_3085440 [Gautieria morchelliformis]|nr:hypothetical protein JB92DRAFT_3085440 [Gautieria morchelliformis]
MRVKQLWRHCDIPAKASLVWSRITFSRLTTIYFIVSVIHCLIQVIIQAQAFAFNAAAADSLWAYIQRLNMTEEAKGFAILGDDLRICFYVPDNINSGSCTRIWDNNNGSTPPAEMAVATLPPLVASVPSTATPASSAVPPATPVANSAVSTLITAASVKSVPTLSKSQASRPAAATVNIPPPSSSLGSVPSSPSITVIVNASSISVALSAHDDEGAEGTTADRRGLTGSMAADMNLQPSCVQTLIWPVQQLSNTKREDILLIGFQVWVLGMSLVALLNESIQHICAALVTQFLVTVWSIFNISQTEDFRRSFARLTMNGACQGMNLLGGYWNQRKVAEILSAVLNGVGLLVTAVLTYKLVKIYGWQTFKRVGASLTINRIYKLVLLLSIALQLGLFFIVAAAALWIDQLYNGPVGRLASLGPLYKGGIIVMFCLLIPWFYLGWFAVRREARMWAMVFLALSLFFVALWAAMFKSTSFRWTFVLWPFFAVMAVVSGALMIISFILGVACRCNFGKGLPRYLNAEDPLEGESFQPVFPEKWGFDDDPEKVDFPSSDGRAVPTFSAAFGKGPEVPRPTHMKFGRSRGEYIARPMSSSTMGSAKNGVLARTESRGSQMSYKSDTSTSSRPTDMGKRWVIE